MQLTDLSSRVIPATEYRRERWRNQLGWTREILRLGDADAWSLRLSIAEIERDAAFSAFPGIDRELVLLHGNGMRLQFGDVGSGSGKKSDVGSSNDRSGADRGGHDASADGGIAAPGLSDRSCDLLPPYQRVRFAGEETVSATLLMGQPRAST